MPQLKRRFPVMRKQRKPHIKLSQEERDDKGYIVLLEDEISHLENRCQSLLDDNQVLQEEKAELKNKIRALSLLTPDEGDAFKEYYTGESDYVLLRALKSTRKGLEGTGCQRQMDVLDNLIENVEKNTNALIGKDYVKEQKRLMKKNMNDVDAALKAVGFTLQRTKGHSIYVWNGDSAYIEKVSSTPSEVRGLKNQIHDTCRKIYGIE